MRRAEAIFSYECGLVQLSSDFLFNCSIFTGQSYPANRYLLYFDINTHT